MHEGFVCKAEKLTTEVVWMTMPVFVLVLKSLISALWEENCLKAMLPRVLYDQGIYDWYFVLNFWRHRWLWLEELLTWMYTYSFSIMFSLFVQIVFLYVLQKNGNNMQAGTVIYAQCTHREKETGKKSLWNIKTVKYNQKELHKLLWLKIL